MPVAIKEIFHKGISVIAAHNWPWEHKRVAYAGEVLTFPVLSLAGVVLVNGSNNFLIFMTSRFLVASLNVLARADDVLS